MNKYYSYLNTAIRITGDYKGATPLKHYLKQFFAGHKKYGSRDRKHISHLCYCYYRLGDSLKHLSAEERIKTGLFLCTGQPVEWGALFEQQWLEAWNAELDERITFVGQLYPDFNIEAIFPWQQALSESIDIKAFVYSHLKQPDLFLRIRPGKKKNVTDKLSEAGIHFQEYGDRALVLPNASKVDKILETDREAVVQDINSQRVGAFMHLDTEANDSGAASVVLTSKSSGSSAMFPVQSPAVWDCCAASGGKSIMASDIMGKINLEVSDNRPFIINNLRERFKRAGIKHYRSFIADLTDPHFKSPVAAYDLIIADVPCTGSGTWARTPEQLYFFKEEKISYYASLQKKIISKIVTALKPGGVLIYITCSVFREENEEAVKFIKEEYKLQVEKMELLKGYADKADTLFAARLIKLK